MTANCSAESAACELFLKSGQGLVRAGGGGHAAACRPAGTAGLPTPHRPAARQSGARAAGSALWQTWYGPKGKTGVMDPLEQEENDLLAQIKADPSGFAQSIITAYTKNGQCGAYPAGGNADRLITTEGLPEGIADQLPVAQIFAALRAAFAGDGGAMGSVEQARVRVTTR